jgi:hypothetical protein
MPLERPPLRYVRSAMNPKLVRARTLAAEIEQLLVGLTPDEVASFGFQVRLAQGLTRSLIDQLEEIEGGPSSSRKLLVAEPVAEPDMTVRGTGHASRS